MALTNEANPMLAKAWVNFNGNGTLTVNDSFNMSSVTDGGVGAYVPNLSITMANVNYAPVCTTEDTAFFCISTALTTTTMPLQVRRHDNTAVGATYNTVAVFGDVA